MVNKEQEENNHTCFDCPLGRRMGVKNGGFCPLLPETMAPGNSFVKLGQVAEYHWFLRTGIVGIVHSCDWAPKSPLTLFGPSEMLGQDYIEAGRYTIDAIALTNVTLCRAAITWTEERQHCTANKNTDERR